MCVLKEIVRNIDSREAKRGASYALIILLLNKQSDNMSRDNFK